MDSGTSRTCWIWSIWSALIYRCHYLIEDRKPPDQHKHWGCGCLSPTITPEEPNNTALNFPYKSGIFKVAAEKSGKSRGSSKDTFIGTMQEQPLFGTAQSTLCRPYGRLNSFLSRYRTKISRSSPVQQKSSNRSAGDICFHGSSISWITSALKRYPFSKDPTFPNRLPPSFVAWQKARVLTTSTILRLRMCHLPICIMVCQ